MWFKGICIFIVISCGVVDFFFVVGSLDGSGVCWSVIFSFFFGVSGVSCLFYLK